MVSLCEEYVFDKEALEEILTSPNHPEGMKKECRFRFPSPFPLPPPTPPTQSCLRPHSCIDPGVALAPASGLQAAPAHYSWLRGGGMAMKEASGGFPQLLPLPTHRGPSPAPLQSWPLLG